MDALWLDHQKLELRSLVPEPQPAPGEALIRVLLAGLCNTDLELLRGYYPFTGIPGHEFVGEVVRSPSNPDWVNQRVVGEISIACGECGMCGSGAPSHCEKRRTLGIHDWNGVFAQYLVLPLVNLHAVPNHVSDRAAVFTEPLAAACEVLEQVRIDPHERVLVIGAGRLGQLVAQVLQVAGCNLEVMARHPRQKQLLQHRHIHVIPESDLGDKKYAVVIEVTGTPQGFLAARRSVQPRGTIVMKSTYVGEMQVNFSGIVVDEITLVGSRCGPFETALRYLAEGSVDPLPLVDEVYPLSRGIDAFEHAGRPGSLKILIQAG